MMMSYYVLYDKLIVREAGAASWLRYPADNITVITSLSEI